MELADFPAFFMQVHGRQPFPWQVDLLHQIHDQRSWPALVDVPTGLGKTATLDLAVFLAAHDAHLGPLDRVGRRRIFFVVDRRLVVDQAAEHAMRITAALRAAPSDTICAEVAVRLRRLSATAPDGPPLTVTKMRGGVTWDSAWLPRPDLPGVVTGTIDQVGSRLLFRGYGVSRHRWSIDAALVGMDSLILVDEAHLARSLVDTLTTAQLLDRSSEMIGLPPPAISRLTATGSAPEDGWTYRFDELQHLAQSPTAAARLQASKTLSLASVPKTTTVKTLAEAAHDASRHDDARVLVVCNTIDRARAVHKELSRLLPDETHLSLLIGRSRAIDREAVVADVLRLFGADRESTSGAAVLVATQTVEVGVDLDATALVSETASWDALVQRIGRVNRRGNLSDSAVIVVHDDDSKAPVYGEAREATYEFLCDLSARGGRMADVSPLALRRLGQSNGGQGPPARALLPAPVTPLLLPVHLDALARTSPPPWNDIPLEEYLHGFGSGVAPVSIAWRDGLLDEGGEPLDSRDAAAVMGCVPLRSEESVEVPIAAVRRWLSGVKSEPVSDWDDDDDFDVPFSQDIRQRVLRMSAEDGGSIQWGWVAPDNLRPGDSIVVPSEIGGLDTYGWDSTSRRRVLDVSEVVALERRRPVLRLDEGLPARLGLVPPDRALWDEIWRWRNTDDPDLAESLAAVVEGRIRQWLSEAEFVEDTGWSRSDRRKRLASAMESAQLMHSGLERRSRRSDEADQFMSLPLAVMKGDDPGAAWTEGEDGSDDGSVHLCVPVGLDTHLDAVGHRAREIAVNLGLASTLIEVVVDAGRWHDLGKVDPRFQAMLFGGDPVRAALAVEPLAKSGMPPGDLRMHRDARRRSGMPRGARHEAWSAALVEDYIGSPTNRWGGDPDLVLHLIASHHGRARPFMSVWEETEEHLLESTVDDVPVTAQLPHRIDLTWADRFDRLNKRYGRWGLALLEAVVRCADTTVSGEGS